MCMSILYISVLHVYSAHRGQRKVSDSLELELQVVVGAERASLRPHVVPTKFSDFLEKVLTK